MRTGAIVLIAVVAAALGALAGLRSGGPGPLLRGEAGQWLLQRLPGADPPPPGATVAKRDEPVPALTLPDLRGNSVRLPADFRGRPLLVNFWASWCAPCIEEIPELQRFARRQPRDGIQVIGIALDDAEAARALLRRLQVDYPILLDTASPADSSVRWGNRRSVLPYTVLIDSAGRLRKQRIGPFARGQVETWVGAVH